jgi:sarcosine oxidase subunit alpha
MSHIQLTLDGREIRVAAGTSVAAALVNHGVWRFRSSVGDEARAPICGMGVCFECRVTIDGRPHQRACLVTCRDGMEVRTDAP